MEKRYVLIISVLLMVSFVAGQIELRDPDPIQSYTSLNMNNNILTGLAEGEDSQDAATVGQVGGGSVDREGDSMEGDLDMRDNRIIGNSGQLDFEGAGLDINMTNGQIKEVDDISGLNFIVPNEELRITEDVDIGGDVNIDEDLFIGQDNRRNLRLEHASPVQIRQTGQTNHPRIELETDTESDEEWQIGVNYGMGAGGQLQIANEIVPSSRSGFDAAALLELDQAGDMELRKGGLDVEEDVTVGGSLDTSDPITIDTDNYMDVGNPFEGHLKMESSSSSNSALTLGVDSGTTWIQSTGGGGGASLDLNPGDSQEVNIHERLDMHDNVNLDGNDLTNIGFLTGEGSVNLADDIDMSGNTIQNADQITSDQDKIGFDSYLTTDDGRGTHYINKRIPDLCSGSSCRDNEYTEMYLLIPWSDEEIIGEIHSQRSSGNRGGRVIDLYYSSRSDISDAVTASLDVMEGWQGNSRSFDTWKLQKVEYGGEEWLALHADDDPAYASTRTYFSGYVDFGSGDEDLFFEVVDTNDEDLEILDEVNYRSYRNFKHNQGLGINTEGRPSEDLEVAGNILAQGDLMAEGDKPFVHQINDTHEVLYRAQESADSRAVNEGSAVINESGEKIVELPQHFSQVVSDEDSSLKIQLTPYEFIQGSLGVTQRNKTQFTVQGPKNQITKFDYRVTGKRDGFENQEVYREK